jgi:DNA polymerase sigma
LRAWASCESNVPLRFVSRKANADLTLRMYYVSLIDFFRYFSHDFQYNNTVISIRAGHLTKESKGWMNDVS